MIGKQIILKGTDFLSLPPDTRKILGWIYSNVTKRMIHQHPEIIRRNEEGRRYIRGLHAIWRNNPEDIADKFPDLVPESNMEFEKGYSATRKFCDFIAALTDDEIITIYRKFYGPEQ